MTVHDLFFADPSSAQIAVLKRNTEAAKSESLVVDLFTGLLRELLKAMDKIPELTPQQRPFVLFEGARACAELTKRMLSVVPDPLNVTISSK